jgi:antitoxin VapB
MKAKRARVFCSGRSQAIRLPKEFRFETDTVLVHRQGHAVVVEPAHEWPEGYVESFAGVPDDFTRPPQGAKRLGRRFPHELKHRKNGC